jgi:TolB protein
MSCMSSRRLRREARVMMAGTLLALVGAGCAGLVPRQVSFAGPTVEGVRVFTLVDARGGDAEYLLPEVPGLSDFFVWAPDGDHALVRKTEDGHLYLADVEQGVLGACLSCGIDRPTSAAFSPRGDRLAIGAREGLFLVGLDGQELRRIASVENPGWISWSPDGSQLAFVVVTNRWDVYRIDAGGANLVNLTASFEEEGADYFAPAWSPAADRIAFHRLNGGLHIMVMNGDGSGLAEVAEWFTDAETFDPGLVAPPSWSPDGERLAFASLSPLGGGDIFVVNVDGTGLANLTNSAAIDIEPAWSPDGGQIAFASNRDGYWEIYVMNADGSAPLNVSSSPVLDERNPDWRPR